jgi:hypothetical protein
VEPYGTLRTIRPYVSAIITRRQRRNRSMDARYELKPHIHGDWKVIYKEHIEITCKNSKVKPEYLVKDNTVFIGTLAKCDTYIKDKLGLSK